jgi:prepilin-type N-terminal cleavage/methylation domain-containing protein
MRAFAPGIHTGDEVGFTLIELLTVLGIIAIMTAIAAPLIPSLLKADQLDSSIGTLSGLLEQARETAISSNTYVWVAFTDAPANSATGTWVATIQSKDGTEAANTSWTSPFLATTTLPIPNDNLELLAKIQNLPGVKIVDASSLPTTLTGTAPTSPSTLFESGAMLASGSAQGTVAWDVSSLHNTGLGSTVYFTHALEFTPNGEAHVPTVYNGNIQFGITPAIGTSKNAVLINVARLTGKTTFYRQ